MNNKNTNKNDGMNISELMNINEMNIHKEKNNKINFLEKELQQRKLQMELDEKQITSLKLNIVDLKGNIKDIHSNMDNMNKGIQITQHGLINIMSNFNAMFPDYSVDIS